MTLLYILIALCIGIVLGATESSRVIRELHKVAAPLHKRLTDIETRLKGE